MNKQAQEVEVTGGVTGEAAADEALVESTMQLIAAQDRAVAAGLRAIGEHILDRYFDADEATVRSKRPHKDKSFARLGERAKAETSFRKRDLYRAVSIAIVWRSLSEQVRDKLDPTQLEHLANLDDLEARRALAARAASGELGGRELRAAITEAGAQERGGGPRPKPPALKLAAAVEKALEAAQAEGLRKRDLKGLGGKEARELAKRLRAAARELSAVADKLGG